jgi:hypothetical protein
MYLYLLNNKIKEIDKKAFMYNYDGESVKKSKLKQIKDEDLNLLDKKLKELDGTLLVDVVRQFIRKHKIFI